MEKNLDMLCRPVVRNKKAKSDSHEYRLKITIIIENNSLPMTHCTEVNPGFAS